MRYYVYVLKDRGIPFYVGKGTRRRMYDHARRARNCPENKPLQNKIRKMWREGRKIEYEKVFHTESPSEAYEQEKELIRQYGKDRLKNVTDGGEGVKGYKPTSEHKRKISTANKQAVAEGRLDLAHARTFITTDPRETAKQNRDKISESLKKYNSNPEVKRKKSKAMKQLLVGGKRVLSEEAREKMRQAAYRTNQMRKNSQSSCGEDEPTGGGWSGLDGVCGDTDQELDLIVRGPEEKTRATGSPGLQCSRKRNWFE